MIKKIKNYLDDGNYQITVTKKYISIINYTEIISFTDKEIILKCHETMLRLLGQNLVISKMLDDEILVLGKLLNLKFGGNND